jgi:iron complex outermembrane receptor protein
MDNVFDRKYMVANSYEWDVIGGSGATPAIVNEPGRFFYASLEMIG